MTTIPLVIRRIVMLAEYVIEKTAGVSRGVKKVLSDKNDKKSKTSKVLGTVMSNLGDAATATLANTNVHFNLIQG